MILCLASSKHGSRTEDIYKEQPAIKAEANPYFTGLLQPFQFPVSFSDTIAHPIERQAEASRRV